MGRGDGSASDGTVVVRRGFDLLGGFARPPRRESTRSLKREFNPDIEEWKRSEKEFINATITDLNRTVRELASSNAGWRHYLKMLAEMPQYSSVNTLWARSQLSRREGVDRDGLVLSESQWAKLGRRVKSEYARPEARRDRRFGYDRNRDWDARYAVEMMKPLGLITTYVQLKDANGNPILDVDGKPKRQKRTFWRNGEANYGTFVAYHVDATEGLDGGEPPELKPRPWTGATGSEDDARKLLAELERRALDQMRISLKRSSGGLPGGQLARLAAAEGNWRTLEIDSDRPAAEQAAAALGILCEQVDPLPAGADEDTKKRFSASVESAKYAIASLYKLDSAEQGFPYLEEIAATDKGLRSLNGEIHRRVSLVLNRLDPTMRDLARQEGRKKAAGSKHRNAKKTHAKTASAARSAKAAATAAA